MTPRYINADLAKAQFTGNFQTSYSSSEAKAMIDEVPKADVEPIVHAKWVSLAYDFLGGKFVYACDRCDRHIKVYHKEDLKDFPYCHCGARMDEEVEKDV